MLCGSIHIDEERQEEASKMWSWNPNDIESLRQFGEVWIAFMLVLVPVLGAYVLLHTHDELVGNGQSCDGKKEE